MEIAFGEEHEDLRRTIRQFMEAESAEPAVREQMVTERGHDPKVWERMAGELGLAGLLIPEEHGGAGFGPVEMLVAFEEMGRALLCAPALSTLIASRAILEVATDGEQAELLPPIATGNCLATLAHVGANERWDLDGVAQKARGGDGSWELDGTWMYVLDGHVADRVLVVARTDDGLGLFCIETGADAVSRSALPPLDLTRKLARLDLVAAPARRLGAGDARAGLERALDFGIIALAAEQVGGAQRCLEMATDYARSRLQFGRPIGSFQAIKHTCADMLVDVELARSAAYNAAFCAASGEDDLAQAVSMARSYCSEAYYRVAASNIQVHGGMGFTWEHPAHLYFKRARSSELLFGTPVQHRERLASALEL